MCIKERTTTMNQILDRFYHILRSMHLETEYEQNHEDETFSEAWKELDDFLNDRTPPPSQHTPQEVPEILRKDYEILEIHFGASFHEVKKRYLHLVKEFHPDQFSREPSQQAAANEKIKVVNSSFQRIKAWEQAKTGR